MKMQFTNLRSKVSKPAAADTADAGFISILHMAYNHNAD